MDKLKIKISPWFYVLAFLFILNNNGVLFFVYFFTIICHELCHGIVANKLGYQLNQIQLMPYGAKISMQNNFSSEKHEILIAIAGPFFNFVVCVVCVSLWWVFPLTFAYTQSLMWANLITFLFNCIPVFPLDGGRVLSAILNTKTSVKTKYKVLKIINVLFLFIFLFAFILSIFISINFNFLIMSAFLIFNLFQKNNDAYYDYAYKNAKQQQLKNGVKLESYAISQNSTLFDCFKLMKKDREIQFFVLNNKYQITKNFSSQQIEELLLTNNTHTQLKDV